MLLNTYEAAATLTVGVDAFRNERQNVSGQARVMSSIAIVGANAINECAVDVYIESFFVGRFRNTHSGAVQVVHPDDDQRVGPHLVPAGSKISAIIAVAPTVSPLIIQVN